MAIYSIYFQQSKVYLKLIGEQQKASTEVLKAASELYTALGQVQSASEINLGQLSVFYNCMKLTCTLGMESTHSEAIKLMSHITAQSRSVATKCLRARFSKVLQCV